MSKTMSLAVLIAALVLGACSSVGVGVADGTYEGLVPSSEQLSVDNAGDIPGGFELLRQTGINSVGLSVKGDEVTFLIDGAELFTRSIEERLVVRDSEGSGPFKANKEVLVLGQSDLILGPLTIPEPVIWPGSFEDSPVITVKTLDSGERGPTISCGADERCLLLTAGVDPNGRYEDANNPGLDENPLTSILVSDQAVEFTLDDGRRIEISRQGESSTNACGLSETSIWDVPADVGLDMGDPVLVYAACPSTPGDTMLLIIERGRMPLLAPLGEEYGGEWCSPGPGCLLFMPI